MRLSEISYTSSSWTVLSNLEQRIKQKIEKVGTPLRDWDIQINYGIKTGYNEAFIITGTKRLELISKCPKADSIIRPILRGRDIRKYKGDFADLWMITTLPSLKLNIDDFPAIRDYLASFGIEKLEQSGLQHIISGVKVNSRKKTSNKWFETQDQIGYLHEFDKTKLIYPGLMRVSKNDEYDFPRFYLDEVEKYRFTNDTYFMTGNNLKFLLALLNSKLTRFLFPFYIYSFDTDGYKVFTEYLEKIPYIFLNEELQKPFIRLVDEILEKKRKKIDTAIMEKQIDELIFEAYDFSNEEIEYINQK